MTVSHETQEPSDRIRRKRLEKQEKILHTAMGLLSRSGLEAVTISNLAAELDYTPGALYRYFPSMDALFSRMQRMAVRSLEVRIRAAVANVPAGVAELPAKLRAVAACFLDETPENAREVALITQMLTSPQYLLEEDTAHANMADLGGILILVDGLLRQGEADGVLLPGNSRERAISLWASLQGAIALSKLERLESRLFDARRIGLALVDELIRAWQTPAAKEDA